MSWVDVDGAGWSWVEVDGAGWRLAHSLVIPILCLQERILTEFKNLFLPNDF